MNPCKHKTTIIEKTKQNYIARCIECKRIIIDRLKNKKKI